MVARLARRSAYDFSLLWSPALNATLPLVKLSENAAGLRAVRALSTLKTSTPVTVNPPGFTTLTLAGPVVALLEIVRLTFSNDELTNVDELTEIPEFGKVAVAPLKKPLRVTMTFCFVAPCVSEDGAAEVTTRKWKLH
jgi:hypothetical protein